LYISAESVFFSSVSLWGTTGHAGGTEHPVAQSETTVAAMTSALHDALWLLLLQHNQGSFYATGYLSLFVVGHTEQPP